MKVLPVIFAICTALCWGMYGPTIGNAQSKLWSPFKPYVFIGVAYLVLAIAGGLAAMYFKGDSFSYSGEQFPPMKWGFLAGLLGALGALFLTSAMMTSKGNALLVMPIVFGGAVSVTALYSVFVKFKGMAISPVLWLGMAMVVTGVILVAIFTPHGHAPKGAAPATATPAEAQSASADSKTDDSNPYVPPTADTSDGADA